MAATSCFPSAFDGEGLGSGATTSVSCSALSSSFPRPPTTFLFRRSYSPTAGSTWIFSGTMRSLTLRGRLSGPDDNYASRLVERIPGGGDYLDNDHLKSYVISNNAPFTGEEAEANSTIAAFRLIPPLLPVDHLLRLSKPQRHSQGRTPPGRRLAVFGHLHDLAKRRQRPRCYCNHVENECNASPRSSQG